MTPRLSPFSRPDSPPTNTSASCATICTTCRAVGSPDATYTGALELMAQYAPHVNVDDILWN